MGGKLSSQEVMLEQSKIHREERQRELLWRGWGKSLTVVNARENRGKMFSNPKNKILFGMYVS